LQRKCEALGICAKPAVDFVICVKAILSSEDEWNPATVFADYDPRTAKRLAQLADFGTFANRPTLREFIQAQKMLTTPALRKSLLDSSRSLPRPTSHSWSRWCLRA
jgi:hypothetical protein